MSPTAAEALVLAAARRLERITPEMVCATITSLPELDGFETGHRERGSLTNDVRAAIAVRRAELQRGRR